MPAWINLLNSVHRQPAQPDELVVVHCQLSLVAPAVQPVLAVAVEGQVDADSVGVLQDVLGSGLGLRFRGTSSTLGEGS